MDHAYTRLTTGQLSIASGLVLVSAGASMALSLGIERGLLVAAVRMVAQLMAVGLILDWVFALDHPAAVALVLVAMTLIAGVSAGWRAGASYRGMIANGLIGVTLGSWGASAIALLVVVRVHPWYTPQFAIPLVGMILGNTMNGVSLGLDRLTSELVARRGQVESTLALGATRWEAALPIIRSSVRTGLIPTINTMAAAGIVTLPGMMTGQMLAGATPLDAVKYQMVIMFLMTFAIVAGSIVAAILAFRRLFTADHQLDLSRLVERKAGG